MCRTAQLAAGGGVEICDNAPIDDDGDGDVDCFDSDCALDPACGGATSEVNCSDGQDNDNDGDADCDDSDCVADLYCTSGGVETDCVNGSDDDGDTLADCDDPDCIADPACAVPTGEATYPNGCTDGLDNDNDGDADCDDSDCALEPACSQGQNEICNDGQDNDNDGDVDCDDTDCTATSFVRPRPALKSVTTISMMTMTPWWTVMIWNASTFTACLNSEDLSSECVDANQISIPNLTTQADCENAGNTD